MEGCRGSLLPAPTGLGFAVTGAAVFFSEGVGAVVNAVDAVDAGGAARAARVELGSSGVSLTGAGCSCPFAFADGAAVSGGEDTFVDKLVGAPVDASVDAGDTASVVAGAALRTSRTPPRTAAPTSPTATVIARIGPALRGFDDVVEESPAPVEAADACDIFEDG